MSPDAGSSGENVAKNRGFVFLPEVGDLVMVGFRNQNPDAPCVMGSLHVTIQANTSFTVYCGKNRESSFEMKADGSILLKGVKLTLEGATQTDLNSEQGLVNLGSATSKQ